MSFLLINLYKNIAVVLNFKEHKNTGSKVVKVESVLLKFDMIQKLVVLELMFNHYYQYL